MVTRQNEAGGRGGKPRRASRASANDESGEGGNGEEPSPQTEPEPTAPATEPEAAPEGDAALETPKPSEGNLTGAFDHEVCLFTYQALLQVADGIAGRISRLPPTGPCFSPTAGLPTRCGCMANIRARSKA
jgi:hypothetical protein